MRYLTALLALFLAFSSSLRSQSAGHSEIKGIVADVSGAIVEGAQITLLNSAGEIVARVTTDKDGAYSVPVEPGTYTLKISASGMAPLERVVTIPPVSTANVDTRLAIASVTQTIEVAVEPNPKKAKKQPNNKSGSRTATSNSDTTANPPIHEESQPQPIKQTNSTGDVLAVLPALSMPQDAKVLIDGHPAEGFAFVQTSSGVEIRGDKSAYQQLADGAHSVQASARNAVDSANMKVFIWKDEIQKLAGITPFGTNYAVVMAVSEYDSNKGFARLPSAVTQAKELANVLSRQGFVIKPLYDSDATKDKLEHYLYSELNPKLRENDRVLIYFGGHGFSKLDAVGQKVGFLVPWDAEKSKIEEKGILMAKVEDEYATQVRAKHIMFVLDACFAGLATRTDNSPTLTDLARFQTLLEIEDLTEAPSRAIIAAGGADDSAIDVNGGIFTRAFMEGIKGAADADHNGVINQLELVTYIKKVVRTEARKHYYHQEPQYVAPPLLGSGEFIFIYK
jgi:hypothetical protein